MTRPLKTLAGLVLTAIMLFPVYWMINVSLTPDEDMRKSPPDLFPAHATLTGYRTFEALQAGRSGEEACRLVTESCLRLLG